MITKEMVIRILEKPALAQGVKKYKYIMNRFCEVDVSKDIEFQNMYRDFYQMNNRFYSDKFAQEYFCIMETLKELSAVSFSDAFERVKSIQNTFETSFSSKMIHTFDPNMPIWDNVVTKRHFGITAPTYPKNREQKTVEKYNYYKEKFYDYLKSGEGQMIIELFDDKFPDSGISDVKKIDFILWQDR